MQIAGRLSQDPPGALKWDRNAFAAELTTASGGSEETGQSPESGGKRSETSTDTAVSAKSVSLNPDTGSRRGARRLCGCANNCSMRKRKRCDVR